MTIIPAEILRMWGERAETAHHLILQNLIDFKPFDAELQHGEKMQAYAEAAKANRMSMRTFQDRFYLVKRFQDAEVDPIEETQIAIDMGILPEDLDFSEDAEEE